MVGCFFSEVQSCLSHRSSFQSQASIISQHIQSLATHLSIHDEIFARLAVYPLPEFPGRTQEGLLGQLLRKKLEPSVEDWLQEGIATGKEVIPQPGIHPPITANDLEELWEWAQGAAIEEVAKQSRVFGGNYTLEERAMGIENVVTGLKRRLPDTLNDSDDSDDSDDDSDEEDEMDVDQPKSTTKRAIQEVQQIVVPPKPPMPINEQLKFLMTGTMPRR
jgi:mediator of RNA polymerase II transcription subunit 8, fungi type